MPPVLRSDRNRLKAGNSGDHMATGFYLLSLLGLFVAWEFSSHLLMIHLEMTSYHALSALVETTLAVAMTGLAVRFLNRQKRLLEHQIALRETMTQMLVHDLRNPLTGLLISLSTLQRRPPENIMKETVSLSMDSASRLKDLVDDILDIARLEELTDALDIEMTSELAGTLQDVADYAARVAKDKQISTEIELPMEAPRLALDLRRFRRVLENLLSNAIKHTPVGGKIRLKVSLHRDLLTGEVSDTGPGIPAKDRERIFGRFEMIGRGARSSSGLGLTFCRLVVEGHQGRIWAEESPEGGSCFKFQIPIEVQREMITHEEIEL
jgi:two-component system, sensor histidine kinase and response regulator